MKKFILFVMLIATSYRVGFADNGNVTLYNEEKAKDGKGNNSELPIVSYDDNEVTLTAVDFINAFVVIRGAEGNVITEEQLLLSPSESTITVPEENAEDGCVIEIYYEDTCLYGYLN